jgi:peptidoglycan/xylan/chitin deacetylase (PgdA/CDA1 family)
MPKKRSKILKTASRITAGAVILTVCFYFFWLYPKYSVPILTYHSFDSSEGLLSVAPENFEKQMRFLKDKGFHVISFDELVEGIKSNRRFSHNTVVITIDDGYKDNFIYAYPILKKYGFPATIFLVTNYINDAGADFLNWDEVREMARHNISFGGHTKNHIYLPSVDKEDTLWQEISGSREAIAEHLGAPADYFCYPYGGFTEEAKKLVKKAGYKGACVTNRGFAVLNKTDLYELHRISVRNGDPYFSLSDMSAPLRFRAKLSGYYNLFRTKKVGN